MYYTYIHIRNDTNKVFYVGKGTKYRAWSKHKRNQHWNNVINKTSYTVHIIAEWIDEQEAHSHEELLISCFNGMNHPLTNKSIGGEGKSGWKHTEESKNKMRMRHAQIIRKPHTEERKKNISLGQKGRVAWNKGLPSPTKGTTIPLERKLRISVSKKGTKYNKNTGNP